jgi:NADPH-dependent 2,4-dienoyl-CoA reductase/sulfur reductase-like enzyme
MTTSPSEPPLAEDVDIAVVGAGPAGMSAAITAADAGRTAAVLDLGDRLGGQYFRHAEAPAGEPIAGPRHGSATFAALSERFARHVAAGAIRHQPRHAVWTVESDEGRGFLVRAVEGERERRGRTIAARAVVIATGAYDRQIPFPGWTLPGVMTAGGAQALLKGSRVAAGRRAVLAGTGPFLLSVAETLLTAGVQVATIAEANAPWRHARHPLALVGAYEKVPEAVGYATALLRHGVPYRTRHAVIAAHGHDRLESVTVARVDAKWRPVPGTEQSIDCDLLAVGYGFTPQVELPLGLGCEAAVTSDGAVVITVDENQRTSVSGVYAAGETTGVGGADLALVEGTMAGAAAAGDAGGARPAPDRQLRARRRRLRRFASALRQAHPVRDGWTAWLTDDTTICRCEEVSYARVRDAVTRLGAADPRAVKLLARPGMGWCQGRMCGSAVAALTVGLIGRPLTADDATAFSRRPLGQPVGLDIIAALGADE